LLKVANRRQFSLLLNDSTIEELNVAMGSSRLHTSEEADGVGNCCYNSIAPGTFKKYF
jgi:hypothetical protein